MQRSAQIAWGRDTAPGCYGFAQEASCDRLSNDPWTLRIACQNGEDRRSRRRAVLSAFYFYAIQLFWAPVYVPPELP